MSDIPSEMLEEGDEPLIMFLRERHAGGLQKVFRMRMMLIGQEDVRTLFARYFQLFILF